MEVSKSSMSVLGGSLSISSFLILFQDLSQNSICSRLMKLSLPIDSLLQMALILFSCRLRALRRQSLISAKVMTFSLWIQYTLLLQPFFLIMRMIFLIWCLLSRGKASCLRNSKLWMNQISLLSSSTSKQTISSFTPYSMGIPLYRFSPTVEMYLRGSMVDGQIKLRKPTKSTFSLQPYRPNRIFTSSSVLTMRFSSKICRMCLLVMSPSPLEMQLKSASGWKSERVVMASRQACKTFSCCSSSAKYPQMLLKISPSFNSARLPTLYLFITILLSIIIAHLYMQKQRRVVVINADDFGCDAEIDRGILHLIRNRCINSTSVLVNGTHVQQAAQTIKKLIQQRPQFQVEVSIGLHFNLTQGKPLSQPILSSQLVENGVFLGKPKIYTVAQQNYAFEDYHIIEQLKAQINRFIQLFGRKPSHIDGHNHVHIIPPFANAIAKTMRKIGIYKTRIPIQKVQKIILPINHQFIHFAQVSQHIYRKNGIIWCRQFVGLQSFGKLSPELLRKAIQNKKWAENVSVEMMCHPGFPSLNGNEWVMSNDRLAELHQLQNYFSQFRGDGSYNQLKVEASNQARTLICYNQQSNLDSQLCKIQQLLNKECHLVYFWPKTKHISHNFNRIDIDIAIKSLNIKQIIQLQPQKSSYYIAQTSRFNNIFYLSLQNLNDMHDLQLYRD